MADPLTGLLQKKKQTAWKAQMNWWTRRMGVGSENAGEMLA